jgi:hypothetical protein
VKSLLEAILAWPVPVFLSVVVVLAGIVLNFFLKYAKALRLIVRVASLSHPLK